MNKNYTLRELADIAKNAAKEANEESRESQWGVVMSVSERPAFILTRVVKAILDVIGYEFPKDEEREAFDAWYENAQISKSHNIQAFEIWKAGREELRRSQMMAKEPPVMEKPLPAYGEVKTEPAWIPWNGGECPLSDEVKRWQYKSRDGFIMDCSSYEPQSYKWNHDGKFDDIIAYRVWE